MRKEKVTMRREFLSPSICFTIYNGENIWKWVLNLVLKFHDDPMVKKFEIVILLRQVWVYARKREGFGSGKSEDNSMHVQQGMNVFLLVTKILASEDFNFWEVKQRLSKDCRQWREVGSVGIVDRFCGFSHEKNLLDCCCWSRKSRTRLNFLRRSSHWPKMFIHGVPRKPLRIQQERLSRAKVTKLAKKKWLTQE